MGNPVLQVRQASHGTTGELLGRYCYLWCPGCRCAHSFVISNEDGSVPAGALWTWDGDLERPTFSPSLLYPEISFYDEAGDERGERIGKGVCHSFVRAGRWEFLSDSAHHLAGQTVDVVPLPDWLVRS